MITPIKICIACGMPMRDASEFAMNGKEKDYCIYCARPDGSMQSFDEKRAGMTEFIVKTQGLDRSVAAAVAESMMHRLPTWKDYFENPKGSSGHEQIV